MMDYYHLELPAEVGSAVVFSAEESRHIARVRRQGGGDRVRAVDGIGCEYDIELGVPDNGVVGGRVLSVERGRREPLVKVTLAQGILKGDNLAEVVKAVSQLGVAEVLPFYSSRTVGGLNPGRVGRLRKVALEAMKSSRRSVLPRVNEAVSFNELLTCCGRFDTALVAWEDEGEQPFNRKIIGRPDELLIVVGPEGGFEQVEIERFRDAGATSFSLGPRPMRAELAATVAVAVLMQALGELSPPGQSLPGKEV